MINMAVAKNSEKNWPVFVKKSCGYVLNMMVIVGLDVESSDFIDGAAVIAIGDGCSCKSTKHLVIISNALFKVDTRRRTCPRKYSAAFLSGNRRKTTNESVTEGFRWPPDTGPAINTPNMTAVPVTTLMEKYAQIGGRPGRPEQRLLEEMRPSKVPLAEVRTRQVPKEFCEWLLESESDSRPCRQDLVDQVFRLGLGLHFQRPGSGTVSCLEIWL
jgi:hypothetical protein